MQGYRPARTRGLVHGSQEAVPGPGQPTSCPGAIPGPWGLTPGQSQNPIGPNLGRHPHKLACMGRRPGRAVSSKTRFLPGWLSEGGQGQNPGQAALGRWPQGRSWLEALAHSQTSLGSNACPQLPAQRPWPRTRLLRGLNSPSVKRGQQRRVPHRAP